MSIDDQEPDGTGAIPDLWDRFEQSGETPRAYAAFLQYRNLPPLARSARRVIPLVYGPEYTEDHHLFKAKMQQCQMWSMTHSWVARALAWDEYQAADQAAWEVDQIRTMRTRHADVATTAIDKVTTWLNTVEALKDWKPADIVRLLVAAVDTERKARGDHERLNLTMTGRDGGAIKVETNANQGVSPDTLREVVGILVEANAFEDASDGVKEAVDAYIAGTGTDTPPD